MGFLDKYLLLWVLALGSSVVLLFVATIVSLLLGEDAVVIFVLSFNMTMSGFILLTSLPVGLGLIGAVIIYDITYPLTAPVLQWVLNIFGPTIFAVVNMVTGINIPYTTAIVAPNYINPVDAAMALWTFLNLYKDLLISSIPTR